MLKKVLLLTSFSLNYLTLLEKDCLGQAGFYYGRPPFTISPKQQLGSRFLAFCYQESHR